MIAAQIDLRKKIRPAKAAFFPKFFKSGPGEYGEGDQFLGITVPDTRTVAKKHADLSLVDIQLLLASPAHEDRLLGLIILVNQYAKLKTLRDKRKLTAFYLKHRAGVNNWDLVDTSAHRIVGDYGYTSQDASEIKKLSRSKRHWDRRMAMVATFAYIRKGETRLTFELAKTFLTQTEDLMHKATGWMLREAGKRDEPGLRNFIAKYGSKMPRTMLRYSIEKFSPAERLEILRVTRSE